MPSANSVKAPSEVKPAIELCKGLPLVRRALKGRLASHGSFDAEERIERRDRPVAGEDELRAGPADRLPGIAGRHPVAPDHGKDRFAWVVASRGVRWLH